MLQGLAERQAKVVCFHIFPQVFLERGKQRNKTNNLKKDNYEPNQKKYVKFSVIFNYHASSGTSVGRSLGKSYNSWEPFFWKQRILCFLTDLVWTFCLTQLFLLLLFAQIKLKFVRTSSVAESRLNEKLLEVQSVQAFESLIFCRKLFQFSRTKLGAFRNYWQLSSFRVLLSLQHIESLRTLSVFHSNAHKFASILLKVFNSSLDTERNNFHFERFKSNIRAYQ